MKTLSILLLLCLTLAGCQREITTRELVEVEIISIHAEPYEEKYYNGQSLVEDTITGERRIIVGVYGKRGEVVKIWDRWWKSGV